MSEQEHELSEEDFNNKPESESETSELSKTEETVEEVKEEKLTEEPKESKTRKSNAIQSSDIDLKDNPKPGYRVSFPSVSITDFSIKLNQFNNLNIENPDSKLKAWKDLNEEAVNYYTVGGLYQDRFTDEKSEFKQGVETKEGTLNSISSLKFRKNEGELKGELALLKVSKLLGLGDVINVPLPHSGIWVTIKPPTERDLIDFYNSIFREKIALGRSTYGLTLSNFSVHINNRLFDFILRHVHSVNFSDISKENLRNYILIHDFPILAWGFACSMYPNGYDYQRACVNNIEECTHITKATINLIKLLWVDNPSLSESQKVIMSENRPNKLTVESYRKYIAEHSRVSGSSFTSRNGITFKLRVPTFNEYTSDGLNWINKINSSIESLILEDTDNEEDTKTELLNQYIKSSALRQFNHFIDFIEVEDSVITDRETINMVLETLSADDEVRGEVMEAIIKFKTNTTIGIVGIPEYKCPNCHKPQGQENADEKFKTIIPLDVMSIVFLALTSKISKILEREI